MSWRFVFAILIVFLGASAWGGIRLGEWLVAHGPVKPEVASAPLELSEVPVLDADGKPFVAVAPQPLMNGQMGVPERREPIAWEVTPPTLADMQAETPISLATTTISMEVAMQIANANPHGLQGLADVGDLMGGAGSTGNVPQQAGSQFVQPVDIPQPAPAPVAAAGGPQAGGNWEAALSQELQACSRLSFFDRPSCSWAARNKYCEPNNAWGRTRDCPGKNF